MVLRADKNETVLRARRLRRSMTLPEGLLWQHLRTRPGGHKFRRQHPIGPYIVDFCCIAAGLVVEVDGEGHDRGGAPARDERRDHWICEQGFRVLRIPARDVLADLDAVVRMIVEVARIPLHHPAGGSPPQNVALGRN